VRAEIERRGREGNGLGLGFEGGVGDGGRDARLFVIELLLGQPLCCAGPVPSLWAGMLAQARHCTRAGPARARLQTGRAVLVPGRVPSSGPARLDNTKRNRPRTFKGSTRANTDPDLGLIEKELVSL
jgi:hypothetical protein